MKKIKHLLLLVIFFASQSSFSQQKKSIEGKWRMISLSDSEMYYNIKKDSLWLPSETIQQFDSTITIATLVHLYKSLFKMAESNFLIFGKKGIYQEIEDDKIIAKGTFSIDQKTKKLKLDITRNNIPLKIEHHFQLKENELSLVDDENEDLIFVYEKVVK